MGKVLLDTEVLAIIESAIKGDVIDGANQYERFLEDLGQVVANHFGGSLICASSPLCEDPEDPAVKRWCVHFGWTEEVPEGGGVYAQYDTDKTIKDWKEDYHEGD